VPRSWALFPSALNRVGRVLATLSLNIPDFTRYAKSQRSQMLGQALGLPTTMTAFAFIGWRSPAPRSCSSASRSGIPCTDRPNRWRGRDLFAALVVLAAQLTTNMAANVVSPSNDFLQPEPSGSAT